MKAKSATAVSQRWPPCWIRHQHRRHCDRQSAALLFHVVMLLNNPLSQTADVITEHAKPALLLLKHTRQPLCHIAMPPGTPPYFANASRAFQLLFRLIQRQDRARIRVNRQRHIVDSHRLRRMVADAAFAAHKQHPYRPALADGDRVVSGPAR